MSRNSIIDSVKQQLQIGEYPPLDDIAKLLTIIDEFHSECQCEHELARQAQIDQDNYHRLIDEHLALITAHNDLIQALEAEHQREHKLVMQAQLDQHVYRLLCAAYQVLIAEYNALVAAHERVGLRVMRDMCQEGSSWSYQWDGDQRCDGYPTPAATVEAALRARLGCSLNRRLEEANRADW